MTNLINILMNHFLGKSVGVLFAVLSACLLPACKTDLSDVWNSIDNIDDRLSQVEKKIEEMNTNIDALSKICDALSSNVSVSSVTHLQDASGYEIVFSDGTKAPRSTMGPTARMDILRPCRSLMTRLPAPIIGQSMENLFWTLPVTR